ncbi:MAG: hypothetical protein M3Q06_01950 [Bacteroidota bacterium]|nr:hypothetical protein [Bacteroidota bacterium]
MRKTHPLYTNAGYWFLLFIPLVAIGFYPTYFAVFFQPTASVIHIHFALMAVWVVVLVVQPFLFKYKKLTLHRTIGKFTYVLVPLLLISTFLMIRFTYYRFLGMPENAATLNRQAVLHTAATFVSITFLYLGLLALFYTLAVINRSKAAVHARYMVATSLTLLGPTVDRIIYAGTSVTHLGGVLPIETVAFVLADGILLFLLWKDYKARRPVKALSVSLLVYLAAQSCYFLLRDSDGWASFVTFVMQA